MTYPNFQWAWRRAFSRRHTEVSTVVCVGSSTTHGMGATTLERTWVNHLARRFGSTSRTFLTTHPGWVVTGTMTPVEAGLSMQSRELAPGAVLSRQVGVCNAVQVIHRRRGGSFTVAVDGQVRATETPTATSGDRYDGVLTITGLPLTAHTVTISVTGTAPVTISGVRVVDTTHESGLSLVSAGLGGSHSAMYATPDLRMRSHSRAVASLDPSLLIFMVGSNDYASQIHPDDYRDNMRAAVQAARAACDRDVPVLLVHGHRRYHPAPAAHAWRDYGNALTAVADGLPDVGFLDLSVHFPVAQWVDTTDLVGADGVHLTDAGHAWTGDLIADALLEPSGPARLSPYPEPLADPADLPGLVAAWDHTTLTGNVGDEVDWSPRAGRETAVLTGPAGRRATLLPDVLAGRPVVVTTAAGRCLQTGPWVAPVIGPLTIMAVVNPGAVPDGAASGILFSGRSGRYTALNLIGDNLVQTYIGGTAPPSVSTHYFGTDRWKVLALTVDNDGTVRLHEHGRDAQTTMVTPGASHGLGGFTIGGNSGMAANLGAMFAEMLVFDRALTGVEMEDALASLARKHALDGAGRTG